MYEADTIAAVATAAGAAGISIVRVSGPEAWHIADRMFRCTGPLPSSREPFTFVHGNVIAEDGSVLDEGLLLLMKAPRSYTGEDVIEIQAHGGSVNARRILRRCLEAGARSAEPGEFTKRAFLNGRMDLVQAEAVADLIHARSERAAIAATSQLEGELSRRFDSMYTDLMITAANLEATLDFAEDELPPTILDGLRERLAQSLGNMSDLLSTWTEGHILREGAAVVIAGRPNVGKSTLLNALTGRDRAIVSDTPGTTRDSIEEGLLVDGFPMVVVDTAGLRESDCDIEQEGIRRTHAQLARADMFMYVMDGSAPPHPDDIRHLASIPQARTLVVLNKSDLGDVAAKHLDPAWRFVKIAARTGAGVASLKSAMLDLLLGHAASTSGQHAVISERHRSLLSQARDRARVAEDLLSSSREDAVTLASDELRDALESLGQITGKAYHDELLNSIFSRFCIGK